MQRLINHPHRTNLRFKSFLRRGGHQTQLATNDRVDQRVFRLPISHCPRMFDELEFLAKL
jgi:hypothetical protein